MDDDLTRLADAALADLTLAEKIGQMTQVELNSATPDEVAELGIGSVLSGGGGKPGEGTAAAWREHVETYVAASRRSRSGIPILYGIDAVHGHNNVHGATIFPHNIGLGATRDAALVRRVQEAAALEVAATGILWSFAPCLAVPQDVRWGRTYEGFSSDPDVVADLGRAAVLGWQDGEARVLACAKHFVGEGAMAWGSAGRERHPWIDWWDGWGDAWQIDQGDVRVEEDELRRVHLAPHAAAVEAGVATVMACYATWHGVPLHAHRHLLTDVLKGELGFEGFVVSDWMAVDQVDADHDHAVERCVNAGIDMVMVPFDHARFRTTLTRLVEDGRVPIDRVDDAVRRILRTKARLGLLDPEPQLDTPPLDRVGHPDHRALAREAAAAGVTVLVDRGVLPLAPGGSVLAAGPALDDVGLACGGWTISWAGSRGRTTDGRTVLDGLRAHLGDERVAFHREDVSGATRAAVGVVAVHEEPYAEGGGDRADLRLPADQVDLVHAVRELVDHLVVLVVSGRPLVLDAVEEVADAIVACWLPGSEADGVADVLVGAATARGRLPVAWPRAQAQVEGRDAPADAPPWPVGHAAGR